MSMLRLMPFLVVLLLPVGTLAQAPAKMPQGAAAAQLRPGSVPLAATEDSRREARALADLLQFSERAQNTVAQIRSEAVRGAVQRSGKPLPEAAQIVDEIVMPDFKDFQGRIEALLVENLAAAFTATELIQIRTFFSSPAGRRWLRTIPVVEHDNERQIQTLGQQVFRDSIERHADELHARGVKF